MIKTTDLMLGNWVEYATGLQKDKRSIPMQVTGIFADTVYLNFEGNEGDVFEEKQDDLRGIPLTEELVSRCGFKKENAPPYIDVKYIEDGVQLKIKGGEVTLYYSEGEVGNIIYLHQLQNAYYMLTGDQLQFSL